MKLANSVLLNGIFGLVLLLAGCGNPGEDPTFSRKGEVRPMNYTSGLRIQEVADGYKVQVRNPQDTTEVLGEYHFSRKGKTNASTGTIKIPVANVALNSTTFVPFFDKLDAHDLIGGVSYANRVSNARVKQRFDEGLTLEIAGGDGLDMERLLMVDPEVLMVYKFGESNFQRVQEQGIPVVMNMEYMESEPLGRAEWIKLIGCMLDRYDEAEKLFENIARDYNEVRELAASTERNPVVFSGSKYEKVWFAPGNKTFVSQFIRDAGGVYAFEHIEGQGNVELDFENVLATINTADYWGLIVSSREDFRLSDLLKMAPEYALINAFREGQVFVCNTAKSDYFGEAVMEPQVILADLVAILHPDLMAGHKHVYFHPVVVDIKS